MKIPREIYHFLGPVFLATVIVSNSSAQTAVSAGYGNSFNQFIGTKTGRAGDINNDGIVDFISSGTSFFFAAPVFVYSGADAQLLYSFPPATSVEKFGYAMGAAGDVDQDGFGDFIITAVGGSTLKGYVNIYSGQTGLLLRQIQGSTALEGLGAAAAPLDDINNDGIVDTLITTAGSTNYTGLGAARVYSGADGSVLLQVTGVAGDFGFGASADAVGDVNNDGTSDFIVGSFKSSKSSKVKVFSGADGQLLYTLSGNVGGNPNDGFGASCSAAGDVDRDGVPDFMATSIPQSGIYNNSGFAKIFSGASGNLLYTELADAANDGFGASCCSAGDFNNDGFGDFAVGSSKEYLRVYSGKDGVSSYRLSSAPTSAFGISLINIGDTNGDGYIEIVVGEPGDDTIGQNSGAARVFSLVPKGVSFFGTGTAGCDGPQRMGANSVPNIGNINFKLTTNRAPQNSLGLVVAGNAADVAGSDPFWIFVKLHVDFIHSTELYAYDEFSDPAGFGSADDPLPLDTNLVGLTYYIQSIWYWAGTCGLTLFDMSSSNGMTIVIQPL